MMKMIKNNSLTARKGKIEKMKKGGRRV